ncbi:hypothetical protein SESBI_03127 [Sesbania bispinosa]|nr:hypothetical protein SESBI_03127 [Sesbania bispinosa]
MVEREPERWAKVHYALVSPLYFLLVGGVNQRGWAKLKHPFEETTIHSGGLSCMAIRLGRTGTELQVGMERVHGADGEEVVAVEDESGDLQGSAFILIDFLLEDNQFPAS